jgi:hypothetical protein
VIVVFSGLVTRVAMLWDVATIHLVGMLVYGKWQKTELPVSNENKLLVLLF